MTKQVEIEAISPTSHPPDFNDRPSSPFYQASNHADNWPRHYSSQVPSMRMTHWSAQCFMSQSAGMINDIQELVAAGPVRGDFKWGS